MFYEGRKNYYVLGERLNKIRVYSHIHTIIHKELRKLLSGFISQCITQWKQLIYTCIVGAPPVLVIVTAGTVTGATCLPLILN